MSIEHLDNLGVDPERALNAVDFYQSYANTVQEEIYDVGRQLRQVQTPRDSSRLQDYRWHLLVDAASSLRLAGQWALTVDMARARELLGRAGIIFRDLGHAFGLFLTIAARGSDSESNQDRLENDIDMLLQLHQPQRSWADEVQNIPGPMNHPQQQAYLLLALCSIPDVTVRHYAKLRDLCLESPHKEGGAPVGALGLPIRHYWDIAFALLEQDADDFLSAHMQPFTSRYIDNVLSARSNRYLWEHAAAPVDVADVDVVGIVSCAVRRFGRDAIATQLYERDDAQIWLPRIGRSLLQLGDELAETEGGMMAGH